MYPKSTQKDRNFSKLYHEIVKNGLWARLSSPAIRVYGVLLTFAHYETGWAYPTTKTITRLSGINKNLVYRAIQELELTGLIEKRKTKKRFAFRNAYRIVAHPEIYPHLLPPATWKRKTPPKAQDGRFTQCPAPADTNCPIHRDNDCPAHTDTCTCPQIVDSK